MRPADKRLAICLAVVVVFTLGCGGDAARPVEFAAHLHEPGLPNLGQVSPSLLRGGQPTEDGIRRLAELGVQIVVNLRRETFPDAGEKSLVEALGMRYVAIPMHGLWTPTDQEVAAFLLLLREHSDKRVFVHCRRGAERTGVAVAAARIALSGWRPADALAEMDAFDFRGRLFPHYARYVRRLPTALASRPAFAGFGRAPATWGWTAGWMSPVR